MRYFSDVVLTIAMAILVIALFNPSTVNLEYPLASLVLVIFGIGFRIERAIRAAAIYPQGEEISPTEKRGTSENDSM